MDGNRDSAKNIKKLMLKEELKVDPFLNQRLLIKQINHKIMMRTMLIYKVMRIRSKLSFKAMKQAKTFNEMVLLQVVKTYNKFNPFQKDNVLIVQDYLKKKRFKYLKEMIRGLRDISKKLAG